MSVGVITGCSSGLGALAALAFARQGDRVYATMRGVERGHQLLDRARAEGLDIRVLELDVTSDTSIEPGFFNTPIAAKAPRPSTGDSPYRTLDDAVVAFIDGGVTGGGDAAEVADAIVEAVARGDGPVHVPVGDSGKWFLNQAQTLGEAEMTSLYEELIGIAAPVGATV